MKRLINILMLVIVAAGCRQNAGKPVVINNNVNVDADSAFIQTVSFPSGDGVTITADVYHAGKGLPVMVLCHQANYSRGEFKETALLFNKLGYNCIAPDLRSGKEINGVENQTAKEAKNKNLPTEYLDAEQDIVAAINYTHQLYGHNVVLLGSSYSASLSLKIAKENSKVWAVMAFSPGEHFGDKLNLQETIKGLDKPAFITSSKKEAIEAKMLFEVINSNIKAQFTPQADGYHGSKALWPANEGNQEYWAAVKIFLGKLIPAEAGL